MILSKKDSNDVLDFIHSTVSCNSSESFTSLILKFKDIVPFDYATCLLRRTGSITQEEYYEGVNVNYPQEWVDLYISKQFNKIDPILAQNFTSFRIQYWPDTYKLHKPPNNFLSIAQSFGLEKGYTHGARNMNNTEASLFSLAGPTVEHDARTEKILQYTIPHLHQVLARASNTIPYHKKVFLTPREKEVLKWLSLGKTSWDVSVILGISEKTINFHVSSLMQKLDAVSRTHAVAIAFQLGLIGTG
ncbi:MAG: autoinducer binding domain-containing protein [Nitrospirota bacterium]